MLHQLALVPCMINTVSPSVPCARQAAAMVTLQRPRDLLTLEHTICYTSMPCPPSTGQGTVSETGNSPQESMLFVSVQRQC